ncbi:MAG: GNAT family N-acetyltransferase [Desulfobacterales bacterium]|jgi:ribosomal protein S18 acetylase RimI-like enzyme
MKGLNVIRVEKALLLEYIRELFVEYADSLDFGLDFQNFQEELTNLPGEYEPPGGCLFIAMSNDEPVGCVGLRRLENTVCEMKRLYVRPNYRYLGIGRVLADTIVREAAHKGYTRMRLDTVPAMKAARKLYLSMGFKEIAPYRYNPIKGARFMEKRLG